MMGLASNGLLCYGFKLPEEFDNFPWNQSDGCIDSWWRDVVYEYKSPFEIYTTEGDFLTPKPSEDSIKEYHTLQRSFEKTLPPIPIVQARYGYYDCPNYLVAIPGSLFRAQSWAAKKINLEMMKVHPVLIKRAIAFCYFYHIPIDTDSEGWYLSSDYS